MKYSETKQYAIDTKHPTLLYIRKGTKSPHTMIGRASLPDKGDYSPYTYTPSAYNNDCLAFAEGMAVGTAGYQDKKCVFKSKSNRAFGMSDDRNAEIALADRVDTRATPAIGEAYAIVATEVNEDNPDLNYHIGYVIAKDGKTDITLEADAGNPNLARPVFDMYDPKHTFHARYAKGYSPASTIVLKRR